MVTNVLPKLPAAGIEHGAEHGPGLVARLDELRALLEEIKTRLPVTPPTGKEALTPAEFGQAVGLSSFTIQDYCRRGRIRATKALSGRGRERGWRIPVEELRRFEREGLLPDRSRTGPEGTGGGTQ